MHLHVLGDWGVADCVGCGWDGGLTAVAAAAAVQAGHVDPVQVVVVLSSSVAQGLVLAVLVGPDRKKKNKPKVVRTTTRGTPSPSHG